MADNFAFSPEVLEAYRQLRQDRRKRDVQGFARTMGATAQTLRTGESAPKVWAEWTPEDEGTMSAAAKAKAMGEQVDRSADVEKQRLDFESKKMKAELEGLIAELRARTSVHGDQSANARSRATNARQVLMERVQDLDEDFNRQFQLTKQDEAVIEEMGRRMRSEAANTYAPAAQLLSSDQAQQLARTPGGRQQLAATLDGLGMQVDPDNVGTLVSQASMMGARETAKELGMSAVAAGQVGPAAVRDLEAAFTNTFRDPNIEPAGALGRLQAIAARTGIDLDQAAAQVGFGPRLQELRNDAMTTKASLMVAKDERFDEALRYARSIGASTKGIEDVIKRIQTLDIANRQVRPGSVSASVSTTHRPGAEDPQAPVTDPREMQRRIKAAEGDPQAQTTLMMQYIAAFPEDGVAQAMQRGLMSAPAYTQWQKKRGYDGAPQDMVWREFERELKSGAKRQKERFERQRDVNRRMGIGPAAPSRDMDAAPVETQTGNIVAGATRRQEALNGREQR